MSKHGAYYAAILLSLLIAACSSPTAPSGPARVSVRPPTEALNVDGAWQGTYRIVRADPSNCGVLIGCGTDTRVGLTLARRGDDLSGVVDLGQAGRFEVKGRVTSGVQVTLWSDPVRVELPCTGRPADIGESVLLAWSAELVGGKSLVGSFSSQQFRRFNVGGTNLCPSGNVRIFAEDMQLVRVP